MDKQYNNVMGRPMMDRHRQQPYFHHRQQFNKRHMVNRRPQYNILNRENIDRRQYNNGQNVDKPNEPEVFSIFVGRVPLHTPKSYIYDLFKNIGDIYAINEVDNNNNNKNNMIYDTKFLFVRFLNWESVPEAVRLLNGWKVHNSIIKVTIAYDSVEKIALKEKQAEVRQQQIQSRWGGITIPSDSYANNNAKGLHDKLKYYQIINEGTQNKVNEFTGEEAAVFSVKCRRFIESIQRANGAAIRPFELPDCCTELKDRIKNRISVLEPHFDMIESASRHLRSNISAILGSDYDKNQRTEPTLNYHDNDDDSSDENKEMLPGFTPRIIKNEWLLPSSSRRGRGGGRGRRVRFNEFVSFSNSQRRSIIEQQRKHYELTETKRKDEEARKEQHILNSMAGHGELNENMTHEDEENNEEEGWDCEHGPTKNKLEEEEFKLKFECLINEVDNEVDQSNEAVQPVNRPLTLYKNEDDYYNEAAVQSNEVAKQPTNVHADSQERTMEVDDRLKSIDDQHEYNLNKNIASDKTECQDEYSSTDSKEEDDNKTKCLNIKTIKELLGIRLLENVSSTSKEEDDNKTECLKTIGDQDEYEVTEKTDSQEKDDNRIECLETIGDQDDYEVTERTDSQEEEGSKSNDEPRVTTNLRYIQEQHRKVLAIRQMNIGRGRLLHDFKEKLAERRKNWIKY